jgi:hypothetical protein
MAAQPRVRRNSITPVADGEPYEKLFENLDKPVIRPNNKAQETQKRISLFVFLAPYCG